MMEVKIERSSRYILGVELAGRGMDWIGHDDGQGHVQDVCQFSGLGTSSMKAHFLDSPSQSHQTTFTPDPFSV